MNIDLSISEKPETKKRVIYIQAKNESVLVEYLLIFKIKIREIYKKF